MSLDNGLAPNRRQAIIWTNADLIHWRICCTRGRWVNEAVWHSLEGNFTGNVQDIHNWYKCEHYWFIITAIFLRRQWNIRADFRFAPSQWETALLCNDVFHWLVANLESALNYHFRSWYTLMYAKISLTWDKQFICKWNYNLNFTTISFLSLSWRSTASNYTVAYHNVFRSWIKKDLS